ncbi:fimbrial protein [Salmonella enterica]|uniref:fimbrial protein n=1 Tax=Salmonella enterica TaxID=28901 RepID=UPI001E312817|nr:fimbrial protein [Salmonella enterica]
MNKIIYCCILGVGLFLVKLPLAYSASSGTCSSTSGTHVLHLSFPVTKISAQNNIAGKTLTDIAEATSSESYSVKCECDLAHHNGTFHEIYYTADPAPGMKYDMTRSGLAFYYLNEYVDVGTKIYVLNAEYNGVPFEHVSNQTKTTDHTCSGSGTSGANINLQTGTNARLSFHIKRSINGTVVIPATDIAVLYAGISSSASRGDIIAKVRISGSLSAPQSCSINADQTIYVDFDTISASDFSSTVGQAITSRKITKTVDVECTGMGDARMQGVDVSFTGTERSADDSMVVTSNEDVGIKVYNKNGTEINVNNGNLPADMENTSLMGHKNGSVTFSAAPASLTGARPKPGTFTASATLTIEFTN